MSTNTTDSVHSKTGTTIVSNGRGFRTQPLLLISMAFVTLTVTALSLLLIRHRLLEQVREDLSQDLSQSVTVFGSLQEDRLAAIDRENSLLAELPPLKALMTSGDDLTVQDGASEFWQLSGDDLFALADQNGRIVASYTRSPSNDPSLHIALRQLLTSPALHFLLNGTSLYACSWRPIYFGSKENGSLLGYVIGGVSMDHAVRQISQPTGVEAAFVSGGQVVVSTMNAQALSGAASRISTIASEPKSTSILELKNGRFLATSVELSSQSTSPIRLIVLKSFGPAERSIARTNRIILGAGFVALLAGTGLMLTLSRLLTLPLEGLSRSVRAFGVGDTAHRIPKNGTREIRELSQAFASMRKEIQWTSQALLESERLATIGRMASSVSHDLRHYLAAVFANAEFLASEKLSPEERAEIFADIRTAVNGTTDMIESLLIFSRTGNSVRKTYESAPVLLERALTVVRAHPDAESVTILSQSDGIVDTVYADGKQIERALSNLLINACQAARLSQGLGHVVVTLRSRHDAVLFQITDNGPGVPESIRKTLFEPFVSEGKQKGTGLGLTLADCIAEEHGGRVVLLSSRPGETIFELSIARVLESNAVTHAHGIQEQHVDA